MNILVDYTIVYTYLVVVFALAFGLSKAFKNNEISRNIIHIFAGLGWLVFKVLFPATIHPIIISASFVILTIITVAMKVKFVEREDGSYGTIYYTSVMLLMSIIGYKNLLLFNLFGLSIICLALGDSGANIIGSKLGKKHIYNNKSLEGSIGCFVICIITILTFSKVFNLALNIPAIIFLSLLCTITELYSGDFDNISIPFVMFIFSYILITNGVNVLFITSIAIGIIIAIIAYKLTLFTIPASFMLFYLATVLIYFGGNKALISIMSVFAIIIVVEKILGKKTANITNTINKESGKRNELQLAANALFAILSVVLWGMTKKEIFIITFFSAIAETFGDSIASDVGILSKKEPIDICTFKRIERGLSGGVSLLGTTMALLICLYSGTIYYLFYNGTLINVAIIVASGLCGILLDSILGSKIQAQYKCSICGKSTEKNIHCNTTTQLVKGIGFIDNTKVNLICNIFSCVVAYVITIFVR